MGWNGDGAAHGFGESLLRHFRIVMPCCISAALVAAAVLVIVPSFMPAQTVDALAARFPSFIPLRQIVLGLDLQGGAYLLMEVDSPSVIKSQVEARWHEDQIIGKIRTMANDMALKLSHVGKLVDEAAAIDPASPTTTPTVISRAACMRINRYTVPFCAPSAIRTPISRVRWLTE